MTPGSHTPHHQTHVPAYNPRFVPSARIANGPRTGLKPVARPVADTPDIAGWNLVPAQFLKLWIGAGIRPPRDTKASQLAVLTGIIGA